MNATEQLRKEHNAILIVLDILERICTDIGAGKDYRQEHVAQILEFLRVFADGCHHRKEEQHLFPALEAAGIPREHGPLGVMLAEHELGRTFVRRMTEAFDALVRGDQKARDRFVYNARGYANLLRMHIQKENEVLFPMAEHVLSEAEQTRLGGEFDQVEEVEVGQGVHEAFHEMLNELRDIYTPA